MRLILASLAAVILAGCIRHPHNSQPHEAAACMNYQIMVTAPIPLNAIQRLRKNVRPHGDKALWLTSPNLDQIRNPGRSLRPKDPTPPSSIARPDNPVQPFAVRQRYSAAADRPGIVHMLSDPLHTGSHRLLGQRKRSSPCRHEYGERSGALAAS